MTTSANTPLRSSRSAVQALRLVSGGRITTKRAPSAVNGAGASVRVASIHATHAPVCSTWVTRRRSSAVFPTANGPLISVTRPRGMPPPSARSSWASPVLHGPLACRPLATTACSWSRRRVRSGGAGVLSGSAGAMAGKAVIPNKYRK